MYNISGSLFSGNLDFGFYWVFASGEQDFQINQSLRGWQIDWYTPYIKRSGKLSLNLEYVCTHS